MKLILLLSFYILTSEQSVTVTNKGEITNGGIKTFYSNGYCVFVDVSKFKGSSINTKVTVKNGRFTDSRMWWGGYYSYPST
jgi:hypothetical protein